MFTGCIMCMIELHAMLAYVGSEDGQDWDKLANSNGLCTVFWLDVLVPGSTMSHQQHVGSRP